MVSSPETFFFFFFYYYGLQLCLTLAGFGDLVCYWIRDRTDIVCIVGRRVLSGQSGLGYVMGGWMSGVEAGIARVVTQLL